MLGASVEVLQPCLLVPSDYLMTWWQQAVDTAFCSSGVLWP